MGDIERKFCPKGGDIFIFVLIIVEVFHIDKCRREFEDGRRRQARHTALYRAAQSGTACVAE